MRIYIKMDFGQYLFQTVIKNAFKRKPHIYWLMFAYCGWIQMLQYEHTEV